MTFKGCPERMIAHGPSRRQTRIDCARGPLYPSGAASYPVPNESDDPDHPMQAELQTQLQQRISEMDLGELRRQFQAQNEFLSLDEFLPERWLSAFTTELKRLDGRVHRNFIPGHKKGGSISRFDLDDAAPLFGELYRAPAFGMFLGAITGQTVMFCPGDDPHTYALYYYTEPGDHIGYHYDTSYYRGIRYTILIGLVDDSSCRLECQLFKGDPARQPQFVSMQLEPGKLVLFNGDKVYHRITPLGKNERRVALTMEYVTSTEMHRLRRFVSNMKDAIAYFGFKQVFKPRAH